jgi:hypothetical protein
VTLVQARWVPNRALGCNSHNAQTPGRSSISIVFIGLIRLPSQSVVDCVLTSRFSKFGKSWKYKTSPYVVFTRSKVEVTASTLFMGSVSEDNEVEMPGKR